jgi:hypothetical protein
MKGLIIKSPWIDKILTGEKSWEIRSSRINIRGPIALIRKGSGAIIGTCRLVDVKGPLTPAEFSRNEARHRVPQTWLAENRYEKIYAWVLQDAKPLPIPIPYNHPNGAVIWVDLSNHPRLSELIKMTES